MKHLSIMIKPASSLCNLRCSYCFYMDVSNCRDVKSYGIMTEETEDAVLRTIRSALEPGDHLTIAFQGGEPTLAGLEYFRHCVSVLSKWSDEIHVNYTLQTNGMILDAIWCEFLYENHFLVGISFDLLKDNHNAMRIDSEGNGTWTQVSQAIKLLRQYQIEYNVLCTLTNQIARYPKQVWKQIQKYDIQYLQFTPCLSALNVTDRNFFALTPKRFSSFYSQIFQFWYADLRRGQYRSIKFFDDIINQLAFGAPTACGADGRCRPQLVVEADGSVYPCDFYCLDSYRLGSITQDTPQKLIESPAMHRFLQRERKKLVLCSSCKFAPLCGGGCERMQKAVFCAAPEDRYCGYQDFLTKHIDLLRQIAAT